MIARRLRDKQARGEPITIENFVIDTIRHIIRGGEWSFKNSGSRKILAIINMLTGRPNVKAVTERTKKKNLC